MEKKLNQRSECNCRNFIHCRITNGAIFWGRWTSWTLKLNICNGCSFSHRSLYRLSSYFSLCAVQFLHICFHLILTISMFGGGCRTSLYMTAELRVYLCPSPREGGPISPDSRRNLGTSLRMFSVSTVLNRFCQHIQFMFQFQILLKRRHTFFVY